VYGVYIPVEGVAVAAPLLRPQVVCVGVIETVKGKLQVVQVVV
jgi:hypothetical protein